MDDATQKLVDGAETAPALIRQALDALAENGNYSDGGDFAAATLLEGVLNRALEAAQRPPVSPEGYKTLAGEAHGWCPACGGSGMVMEFEPTDCPNLAVHRALEAAQRPPERDPLDPEDREAMDTMIRASERGIGSIHMFAQRPPASPEVRELLILTVRDGTWEDGQGWNLSGPLASQIADAILARFSFPTLDVEKVARELFRLEHAGTGSWEHWDKDREVALRHAEQLVARFSFPSQPVYEEEAIARWLVAYFHGTEDEQKFPLGHDINPEFCGEEAAMAAALVAALRGGELTREEESRG